MTISPPSDVVLDVARNADPSREASAIRRLEALAARNGAEAGRFDAQLQAARGSGNLPQSTSAAVSPQWRPALGGAAPSDRGAKVSQELEATVLSTFVNEMMPKDASAAFGKGVGADAWKSMLADQLAHQLAKSGALGLSRRLFASHPLAALQNSSALHAMGNGGSPSTAQTNPAALSLPLDPSTSAQERAAKS